MDSTHKGRQPHPEATSQPGLFDGAGKNRAARDEVKAGVSAEPNLPIPGQLNGFQAYGQMGADTQVNDSGPVLVAPPPVSSDPLWIRRLKLVLFVLFCIELGMLLAVLPWTRVWTENSLLTAHPDLRSFLQHDFLRGAITGLGLIDIWLGIREAVNYRER
jgi:hypothetical protein